MFLNNIYNKGLKFNRRVHTGWYSYNAMTLCSQRAETRKETERTENPRKNLNSPDYRTAVTDKNILNSHGKFRKLAVPRTSIKTNGVKNS